MDPKKIEQHKKIDKKSSSSTPRIVTMDSIRNRQQEDSEGQAYYAGGSEHSGQQILGRDQRANDDSQALAEALMRASSTRGNNDQQSRGSSIVSMLNEHSVDENSGDYVGIMSRETEAINFLEDSRLFSDESGRNQLMRESGMISFAERTPPFGGVGHRLGDTQAGEPNTEVEQSICAAPVTRSVSAPSFPRVTLRLWQNGFNVDSGPLFSYNDPSCSELISNVLQGEVPPQILPPDYGGGDSGPVHVTVIDRRGEKYEESVRSFSGKGHVLGSPTPSVCGLAVSNEQSGSPPDRTELSADSSGPPNSGRASPGDLSHVSKSLAKQLSASRAAAANDFTVDGPTDFVGDIGASVVLKIRLPNGELIRLKVKGEENIHTVKTYLMRTISSLEGVDFNLLLSFPKRVLGNEEVAGSSEIRSSLLILSKVT